MKEEEFAFLKLYSCASTSFVESCPLNMTETVVYRPLLGSHEAIILLISKTDYVRVASVIGLQCIEPREVIGE